MCEVLGIANSRDALARLDDDEKGVGITDTVARGAQRKATINESGLYSLILRSRKPEAKRFKRWVTHEVLPSIRRNGFYGDRDRLDRLDRIEKALTKLATGSHHDNSADLEAEALRMSARIGLARVTTLAYHLRSFMRPHVAFELIERLVEAGKLVMVVSKSTGPQLVALPWKRGTTDLDLASGK